MDSHTVNLERIVSDYNATLHERDDFGEPWDRDSLDGVVVRYHSRFHIWVNARLSEYQKTSVTLHEVGHIATWTVGVVWSLICERMCDEWALDSMIPDDTLQEALAYYGEDWEGYAQLFGVSYETFCKKLWKKSIRRSSIGS